ncbi:hypothetical protein [Shewanella atlantica]|uniref:Phosphatidylinositol diacylglycerol-lyase n=1 Tax=Shewanella atlantica TaxID=271099 RepID=A0A431VS99_9GAMM|nr:hypothetical protein [Shewanella atlantica]RTR26077.1 hypothetical protein EKG39_22425 [Shewanella atlantica]
MYKYLFKVALSACFLGIPYTAMGIDGTEKVTLAGYPGTSSVHFPDAVSYSDWMGELSILTNYGELTLNDIIIPGSHNSPAYDMGAQTLNNQENDLETQLNSGSRVLEFDVLRDYYRWFSSHGGQHTRRTFEEEGQDIVEWLAEHPSEIVIIFIDEVYADGSTTISDSRAEELGVIVKAIVDYAETYQINVPASYLDIKDMPILELVNNKNRLIFATEHSKYSIMNNSSGKHMDDDIIQDKWFNTYDDDNLFKSATTRLNYYSTNDTAQIKYFRSRSGLSDNKDDANAIRQQLPSIIKTWESYESFTYNGDETVHGETQSKLYTILVDYIDSYTETAAAAIMANFYRYRLEHNDPLIFLNGRYSEVEKWYAGVKSLDLLSNVKNRKYEIFNEQPKYFWLDAEESISLKVNIPYAMSRFKLKISSDEDLSVMDIKYTQPWGNPEDGLLIEGDGYFELLFFEAYEGDWIFEVMANEMIKKAKIELIFEY